MTYWHLSPLERNSICLIAYPRNNIHASGIWGPETQTLTSKCHRKKGRVEVQVDWTDLSGHKLAQLIKFTWRCGIRRCCAVAVGGSMASTHEEGNGRRESLGEDWEMLIDGRAVGLRCWHLSSQVPREPTFRLIWCPRKPQLDHFSYRYTALAGEGVLGRTH